MEVWKDKMALGIILHTHVEVAKGDDVNQKRGSGACLDFRSQTREKSQ